MSAITPATTTEKTPNAALMEASANILITPPDETAEKESAASKVFKTPELLESIMLPLPIPELFKTMRVSKTFHKTIEGSVNLQREMHVASELRSDPNTIVINPLLETHNLLRAKHSQIHGKWYYNPGRSIPSRPTGHSTPFVISFVFGLDAKAPHTPADDLALFPYDGDTDGSREKALLPPRNGDSRDLLFLESAAGDIQSWRHTFLAQVDAKDWMLEVVIDRVVHLYPWSGAPGAKAILADVFKVLDTVYEHTRRMPDKDIFERIKKL